MSAAQKAVRSSKTSQTKGDGSGKAKQSSTKLKKAKSVPVLLAVKPINMETEKTKFFDSGGTYNPQFVYACDVSPKTIAQYGQASDKLITQVRY